MSYAEGRILIINDVVSKLTRHGLTEEQIEKTRELAIFNDDIYIILREYFLETQTVRKDELAQIITKYIV